MKQWWRDAKDRSELPFHICKDVADMGYARQRFDGVSKPMGRSVVFIDAYLSAANMMISQRAAKKWEHIAAAEFLSWLTNEAPLCCSCDHNN
jgi:hypothetical protein